MTIKEYLKKTFGDKYTDEIDKEVGKELGADYVPKGVHAELITKSDGLQSQLDERDKQLEKLKTGAKDSETQKAEIERLQGENKATKESYEKEMESLRFTYALESKLISAGAKNAKAVTALLDSEKLSLDGDNIIGLDEQLKAVREKDSYLFDETKDQTAGPGAGGNPPPAAKPKETPRPSGAVVL